MVKNVYIHIPFCRQKCKYCSFISFPKIELKDKYINSLITEIQNFYKKETLNTLYFGGGTPSLLEIKDFQKILQIFNITKDTEITVELNPENLTFEYLLDLKRLGINRLSFGCQTFDNEILKIIGRKHTSIDVENVVKNAQKAGFENISLDFIYGLPNQSIENFSKDLEHAVSLGIQHISLYGLKIDEDCYFYNHMPDNLPDDDIQADMYLKAIEIMKKHDFEHYEISNFSKKGYNSRHNLNCWDNNSYYGFGTGAHGYIENIRYSNQKNIEKYIENPLEHLTSHKVTEQEKLEEEIFLGFRKMNGINVVEINTKFNIDFRKKYAVQLKEYVDTKYLLETINGYRLSESGILVSNVILSEFLE